MQLESRDLRLVRAIVDARGVTGAGALLHLSQSAVSHQLAELERRLGVTLFARVGRRLVATAAGERLAGASRPLLDGLAQLESELRAGTPTRRTLKLATECYTCYHWLPSLLPRFAHLAPDVDVEIVLEATRQPLGPLLDGRIDLALVSAPVSSPALVAVPLFADEMVMIVAKEHPLAKRPFVRPEDVADETFFTHELTAADVARIKLALLGKGNKAEAWQPKRVRQVPLTEAIVELVRAGLGVSVVGRWAIEPQLRAGGLVALPIGRRGVSRKWSALYRRADAPDALRAFVELLRQARGPGRSALAA